MRLHGVGAFKRPPGVIGLECIEKTFEVSNVMALTLMKINHFHPIQQTSPRPLFSQPRLSDVQPPFCHRWKRGFSVFQCLSLFLLASSSHIATSSITWYSSTMMFDARFSFSPPPPPPLTHSKDTLRFRGLMIAPHHHLLLLLLLKRTKPHHLTRRSQVVNVCSTPPPPPPPA